MVVLLFTQPVNAATAGPTCLTDLDKNLLKDILPREASPAPEIRVRETAIAAVKVTFDPDSLSALWDKARAMPLDQAIDYALRHLQQSNTPPTSHDEGIQPFRSSR